MMSRSETAELMNNLKRLSEVDEQLARLADRRRSLEGQIASLENDIAARKNEIDAKLHRIKEDSHQEHKNEVLLKETEQEKNKVQVQLNVAKTNAELRIFKKKRQELETRISELEDGVLSHLTQLDRDREELETARKELQTREQKASEEIARLRDDTAECDRERAGFSGNRAEIVALIPKDALRKYERVFAKEKHRPVVGVKGTICQGCFMQVTLQEVNLIMRGEDLVLCRNCNRILYLAEDGE